MSRKKKKSSKHKRVVSLAGVERPIPAWLWPTAIAVLTGAALWPVWAGDLIPLQDYPQHLLQAAIVLDYDNPVFDYHEHYTVNLRFFSYFTFYGLSILLGKLFTIETAGRLVLSIYLLSIAGLVLLLRRRIAPEHTPWALLLLFPFAFHPHYFLGNMNYVLSLPMLCFTLLDAHDLPRTKGMLPLVRHLFLQLLVFITHPFTLLVSMALVFLGLLASRLPWRQLARSSLPLLVMLIVFCLWWYLYPRSDGPTPGLKWFDIKQNLHFFVLMFTGMKIAGGANVDAIVLWVSIFACLGLAIRRSGLKQVLFTRYGLFFAASMSAVLVFPFRMGHFSYINSRVADISYFLLALSLARIRFGQLQAIVFFALVALAVGQLSITQHRYSTESSELVPLIEQMPKNATLLPLIFDNRSTVLDHYWFDGQLHTHNYYHLRRGGGFSPYFFKNPLTPVHYKEGSVLPAPGEYRPHHFRWQLHGPHYDFILTRGEPPRFPSYIDAHASLVGRSGAWALYRRK